MKMERWTWIEKGRERDTQSEGERQRQREREREGVKESAREGDRVEREGGTE